MNTLARTLLAAVALAASGLAQAQIDTGGSLVVGGPPVSAFGFTLDQLTGQTSLSFSDEVINALGIVGAQASAVGPATGTINDDTLAIHMPVLRLPINIQADDMAANGGRATYTTTTIGTTGGITLNAPTANFATSGGSLTLSGFVMDLTTQGIYADVAGANGLARQRIHMWNFASTEGRTTFPIVPGTTMTEHYQLKGLSLTEQGLDLFAQGLGLTPEGIATMAAIGDFGTMDATFSMTSPIPESSTYLMMGLGLIGVALTARQTGAAGRHAARANA